MTGMCIFFVLPVFKCSVSCGTGIQVRKIECVLPALANGPHPDYLHSQNGDDDDDNTNKEKNDQIESLSDAPSNGFIHKSMRILSNEQISIDCDPKLKPIAAHSCTTGIECTTIINDNIDSSSHEEADRITNVSNENEDENRDENMNENGKNNDNTQINGDDDDNESTNSKSDNVEDAEDVNVDQNAYETSVEGTNDNAEENVDGKSYSEETEGTEVFCDIQWLFLHFIFYVGIIPCIFWSLKITNVTNHDDLFLGSVIIQVRFFFHFSLI